MARPPELVTLLAPPRQAGPGPAPLLILMHGVGANETSMMELTNALDPRFIRLSLRGPLPLGPNAFGWFHVAFIPAAVRNHGADPSQVYLLGFSQGAIMATSLLLSHPDLVAGAVAWSGRTLPEAVRNAQRGPMLSQRDALVIHGQYDQTLPVQHGQATRNQLRELALHSVTYHELAMGHQVTAESLAKTNHWLELALAKRLPASPQN